MVLHELVHDVRLGWLTVKRVLAESCRGGVWGTRCRDEEIGVVVLADRPAGQKASSGLLAARPLAQALSQVVGKEGSQERRAGQRTGLSDWARHT